MPAKSKSQQRLFGMVHAYKKGDLDTASVDSDLLKKVKKIAGGIKNKDAKKFAKTKHKGLPELKETHKITFKEFLVEITQRERKMLVPPLMVQKLYKHLKDKHGIVKRDVFYTQLADEGNLSAKGLERIQNLPSLRALAFDDQSQDEKPIVTRRDPWSHVTQKHMKREQRAKVAGVNTW